MEPIPFQTQISYVKMMINNFTLKARDCQVSVWEYSETDKLLDFKHVYVPPEVYEQWMNDDQYIIDYTLTTLGYVKKPEFVMDI